MTHTPRPWLRDGRMVYALNEDGFNRFGASVQDPHTPEAELIAVATLMQSAPDLLEALESLCVVVGKMKPASGEPYGRAVAELIEARTVIAKARGQS